MHFIQIMLKFCILLGFYLSIYSSEVLSQNTCKVSIKREVWGETYDSISKKNVTVNQYTLDNCKNTRVQIISYGASITSILTPDSTGKLEDIVLGFDDIKGNNTTLSFSIFRNDFSFTFQWFQGTRIHRMLS